MLEERQGYDVLKMVVHSDRCYMSTDYIRGKPLILWMKYHPKFMKEQLYRWIRSLLEELEHFHRCRGNPCYQYVNPYSIIVGEDERLYLLDLGSKEQEEMLHVMQRRYVRENFLSPENQYYQKASVREDIYSFGKTLQYVLSVMEVDPALGKLEEIRLQKIISRCLNQNSKKNYQTIQELLEHFPNKREPKIKKGIFLRRGAIGLLLLIGAAFVGIRLSGDERVRRGEEKEKIVSEEPADTTEEDDKSAVNYREEIRLKQEQWDEEKQKIEEAAYEREKSLIYELALLYFVELEDYQKSREVLESIEKPERFDEDFIRLCEFLEGQIPLARREDMEELLTRLEEDVSDLQDERYLVCIARGYEMIEEEEKEQIEEAETEETTEETE